ncbi:hypothetical protein EON79_11865 [bacterium]|nr:MAG: hypothetical protein EON79_11865 [bacterium]
MKIYFGIAGLLMVGAAGWAGMGGDPNRVPVNFTGGFETDPQDGGRPVVLVAGALGVKPQVFRDAFSRVNPARDGAPSDERVHANKDVLLAALAPYGITNDRLDEVSDHYRYRPEEGERWPTRPAKAFAILKGGEVVRFEIIDPGYGYTSAPLVGVKGMKGLRATLKLAFSADFGKNGSVKALALEKR